MKTKSLVALALSVAVVGGSVVAQGEKPSVPIKVRPGNYVWGIGATGPTVQPVGHIVRGIALGGRHGVIRKTRNPLLAVDGYEAALDKVSELHEKLDTTTDPKDASLLLDEMTRAIFDTRRALWVRERKKR
jgi:hypothetical protein